jgi:uncharacterized membrane protein YdbT with pleckstrin-like domain
MVEAQPQAVGYVAEHAVPAHLLDGGEIVILAIKPSLWFILLTAGRWLAVILVALLLAIKLQDLSGVYVFSPVNLIKMAMAAAALRVAHDLLQWVSRLYVLTNRRVMRIRGVFNVDIFECSLVKIQNTFVTLSIVQRVLRLGSVHFATAGTGQVEASWQHVGRPLEIHQKVRETIRRAQNRGGNDSL